MATPKQKSKIENLVIDLQWLFQVQNYQTEITYQKEDHRNFNASVKVEEDYQRISINIYPHFFTETEKNQRKDLLHEFSHTITDPLSTISESLLDGQFISKETIRVNDERATCQIENILDALLDGRKSFALRAYKSYLTVKKKKNEKKGSKKTKAKR